MAHWHELIGQQLQQGNLHSALVAAGCSVAVDDGAAAIDDLAADADGSCTRFACSIKQQESTQQALQ